MQIRSLFYYLFILTYRRFFSIMEIFFIFFSHVDFDKKMRHVLALFTTFNLQPFFYTYKKEKSEKSRFHLVDFEKFLGVVNKSRENWKERKKLRNISNRVGGFPFSFFSLPILFFSPFFSGGNNGHFSPAIHAGSN